MPGRDDVYPFTTFNELNVLEPENRFDKNTALCKKCSASALLRSLSCLLMMDLTVSFYH